MKEKWKIKGKDKRNEKWKKMFNSLLTLNDVKMKKLQGKILLI